MEAEDNTQKGKIPSEYMASFNTDIIDKHRENRRAEMIKYENEIRAIRKYLLAQGYDEGEINGIFASMTPQLREDILRVADW